MSKQLKTAQRLKIREVHNHQENGKVPGGVRSSEEWEPRHKGPWGGTGRETREVSTLQMKAVATARTHPPVQADPRPHSHSTREAVRQPQLAAPSRKTGIPLRLTLA